MGTVIVGLGAGLPERVMTNRDLEHQVETSHEWIVERTGIEERRLSAPGDSASVLGTAAARRALAQAGLAPEAVDGIIVATTTPDQFTPSTACLVQRNLGAARAFAFDISAACTGFLYALTVADGLLLAGRAKTCLVLGVDLLTRALDWGDRSTCILFGDGAGAAVVSRSDSDRGLLSAQLFADGSGYSMIEIPGGAFPAQADGTPAAPRLIRMKGKEVFRWAVQVTERAVRKELEAHALRPQDVRALVLHQANIRIVRAVQERLGFSDAQTFVNVQKYGNTSAASIPIALEEARRTLPLQPGDLVVMAAMGAGLTWGTATMRW
ncbi:MAG: ketoacyl-ACP synthase III [Nitrospirae bacterium]|nr:ketoacyl-ACP synthase III [Nitrospirota bacterium]